MIIPLIYGAAVPLPRHDARLIPLVEDSIRQIFDVRLPTPTVPSYSIRLFFAAFSPKYSVLYLCA